MDFSKFSDAEFDAKEWVNGALRAHKESQTPVDVSAGVGHSHLNEFLQLSLETWRTCDVVVLRSQVLF